MARLCRVNPCARADANATTEASIDSSYESPYLHQNRTNSAVFLHKKTNTCVFVCGASEGHEASSGQSCELSVARVNEADAFGNAEVGHVPAGFESLSEKKQTLACLFVVRPQGLEPWTH